MAIKRRFYGANTFFAGNAFYRRSAFILLPILMLFLLSLTADTVDEAGRAAVRFSSANHTKSAIYTAMGDLNHDGTEETYKLHDRRVTVYEDGKPIWVSPVGYDIDCFTLADVTNDGTTNLILSLWKHGSFGSSKPFWHEEQAKENEEYKNHLFVYRYADEGFKQVWCSSSLVRPIVSFSVRDSDGDGLNELVVIEGEYKQEDGNVYALDTKAATAVNILRWAEWGFIKLE